jgi:ATP-binding cassette subfamily D (ALD) long-chain fatty acid import protein
MIIFNYQLFKSVGLSGSTSLMMCYLFSATLVRVFTPPFGALAAKQAKLEVLDLNLN